MKFKLSMMAAAISLLLTGCNDSESTIVFEPAKPPLAEKPEIQIPTDGKFIFSETASVEGLYYRRGDSGYTAANTGNFTGNQQSSVVSFTLGASAETGVDSIGNESNGFFIGGASMRGIITPYTVLDTQRRVTAFTQMLLTINAERIFGNEENTTLITIPQVLRNAAPDSALMNALEKIDLGNLEASTLALRMQLSPVANTPLTLVSSAKANTYIEQTMATLPPRGSTTLLTHWAKGSQWSFIRHSILQDIGTLDGTIKRTVNLDNSIARGQNSHGLKTIRYTASEEGLITKATSNNATLTGNNALALLVCQKQGGRFSWSAQGAPLCDDKPIDITNTSFLPSSNAVFAYNLLDPTTSLIADETTPWQEVSSLYKPLDCMAKATCNEQLLTQFALTNDSGNNLKETRVTRYDPIADVYIEKKSTENISTQVITNRVSFMYPVENTDTDRYVDFTGTWKVTTTTAGCKLAAKSTLVFTAQGVTRTGYVHNVSGKNCTLEQIAAPTEQPYHDFANEYWWFATNAAGQTKATLEQLNMTLRWNDNAANPATNKFTISQFTYMPAGADWDRGKLTGVNFNESDGTILSTVTMLKQQL